MSPSQLSPEHRTALLEEAAGHLRTLIATSEPDSPALRRFRVALVDLELAIAATHHGDNSSADRNLSDAQDELASLTPRSSTP